MTERTSVPRPGSFGARLTAGMQRHGRLCVGIDPHAQLLSAWGLSDDAKGLRRFGAAVVEASAGRAAVVKPQVAFFERHGAAGLAALAEVQQAAREKGLMVIADAKRGDIGSTMAGYAQAWLHPGSDLAVDALTVSPFLGFGALMPAVDAALEHGAGLFVLALTSNPEGQDVQLSGRGSETVAGHLVRQVAEVNSGTRRAEDAGLEDGGLGDIGLVVGATTASLAAEHGIDLSAGRPPLLAPGYGAQGATAADMRTGFGRAYSQVLVNSSRGILQHGPDPETLASAIERTQDDVR